MSRLGRIRELQWHGSALALQLTGALLLVGILPLLIYYVVSYTVAERTILDIASQQSLQSLRNQRDYLQLQVDQIESLAANLSQVDEITSALHKINTAPQVSAYDTLAAKARIGYLLSNYRNLKGLVSIDVAASNGAHFHVGDTLTESDDRSGLRALLLDRTRRSQSFVTWLGVEDNVDKYSSSQKVLVASKLLVSSDAPSPWSEPVVLLLINYSTAYLYEHFSSVGMGPGASLLVIDDRQRLIYHPDKGRIGQRVTADFTALLKGPSSSFTQRLGGSDVLLSYELIPDKNWYVVSIIPKETLLAPMATIRRAAGIMLAVMLVLILLLLRLVALRVVAPIGDITEGFKNFQLRRIAPGWRMQRPKSLKPIADLVQWFNTFLETMERRQESDTRLRIAATAFECQEGMFVLDADTRILQSNGALHTITGYTAAEVIGKTPDVFSSDRHDADFFHEMRLVVERTGCWRGEVWNRRRNGELYPAWVTVTGVRNDGNALTHFVATLTDITERKASEEEIRQLAFYDPLTGLPNRRLLVDRLRQAMLDCRRRKEWLALMFLDLDKFKTLNDTLGHDSGDALLRKVAQRLVLCARETDTVARLGGDEFVVLVEGLGSSENEAAARAEVVALKMLRTLGEGYEGLTGSVYHSTSSIGVAVFSGSDCSLEELMKQADIALYQAKEGGRNTVRFFDPAMQTEVVARDALERALRQGLLDDQFKIYFQPKVGGRRCIVGAEVLVRWDHPERGIVLPQSFIALAEETGLIVQLGQVVLRKACAQLVEWSRHPARSHLGIAVNVSPREFGRSDYVAQVLAIVDQAGADPSKLTLEITESLLVDNVTDIIEKMTLLRSRGIRFALDDFGTGYSSLAYLKKMPLQELKIDRSFVRDVLKNANDATIARAIIALGHELGIEVVAEGVETEAQYSFLAADGCRWFQGYLFSPPVPLALFHRLLDGSHASVIPTSEIAHDETATDEQTL